MDKNPTNYQEQVEKLAFSPSNLLDGAELSDDKMLQGRSNIYWDSQRHRLGSDFRKIPINHQANWSPTDQVTSGAGRYVAGRLVRSEIPKADNFTQAGQFYQSLTQVQQDHLVQNLAGDLSAASPEIQRVVLGYLYQADATLAERVGRQIAAPKKG
ncbi:Catalase [compost metagenome]